MNGVIKIKNIVYVRKNYFVSTKEESIKFRNVVTKETRFIPANDIEMLIFDSPKSYFSNSLIELCTRENIGILFCNSNHVPITTFSTKFNHTEKLKRLYLQLKIPQKIKNRMWKKVVNSKINNQADCLRCFSICKDKAWNLDLINKEVKEGDSSNREAYAARIYFKYLFGDDFKRGRFDDLINASLNYGYALLRGLIRKELSAYGFEQSIGFHHHSVKNPFNLSDDIIEAFRPFVDLKVYEIVTENETSSFDSVIKEKLFDVFFDKCVIDEKVMTITDAIKITIISLIDCYENKSSAHLKLPSFIEGGL